MKTIFQMSDFNPSYGAFDIRNSMTHIQKDGNQYSIIYATGFYDKFISPEDANQSQLPIFEYKFIHR